MNISHRMYGATSAGSMATSLFGSAINTNLPKLRPIRKKDEFLQRTFKVVFPHLLLNKFPLFAILPCIDNFCLKETMGNYRQYAFFYNNLIRAENDKIKEQNRLIRGNIEAGLVSEMQLAFANVFYKTHTEKNLKTDKITYKCDAIEYNKLADDFNANRGLTIKKRNFDTLKYATELVFQQMLIDYRQQLEMHKNIGLKVGAFQLKAIQAMEINSQSIYRQQRDGIKAIDICKATIRNHRKKLEQAGILIDYCFKGHKQGIKTNINPDILVVFDAKTNTIVGSENQIFNVQTRKVFFDKREVQEQLNINIKKTKNGIADFTILGTASPILSSPFLQEHSKQNKNSNLGAAEKNVKVYSELSEKLTKSIDNSQQLAVELSKGLWNGYVPIDIRLLHRESMYGTMTREEFKALVLMDFSKSISKLYRTSTPFVGSYKKMINAFFDEWFWFNNGEKALCNKQLMVDKLAEYRWRLEYARRRFEKYGFSPLYPHMYFDKTRTDKKEMGFEYTKIAYARHKKYLAAKPTKDIIAMKQIKNRKSQVNFAKYLDTQYNRFKNNRISLEQMTEIVAKKLPLNFLQNLPIYILKKQSQTQKK